MTDAKQPERAAKPFTPGDAAHVAAALSAVSAAVGKTANHLDQFAFGPDDAKYGETLRQLLKHTSGCLNELVGMGREYAARKAPTVGSRL